MGLGGPNLVKGAVGQVIDAESLGGARMHTTVSGVAHYMAATTMTTASQLIRAAASASCPPRAARPQGTPPAKSAEDLYDLLPADHRLPYNMEEVIAAHLRSATTISNSSPTMRPKCCAPMRASPVTPSRSSPTAAASSRRESGPRIGGIVYTESARKVAYFVENAERTGTPLIYLQDVSGFMVGAEAETRRHHPRRSRNGGVHGLRHRSQNHPDPQPRQRRRLLRHGRTRLRSQLHLRLAHRPHRRDGRRLRRAGRPRSANSKS